MTDNTNHTSDGVQEFTINYSEREITCRVDREGDILHLHMDNNMNADLEIQPDGTLKQVSGDELAQSNIDYICRRVLSDKNTESEN
jgi:hypothetical protein